MPQTELERKVDILDRKLDTVINAVSGNVGMGIPGVVGRLKDHDFKLEEMNLHIKNNEKQIVEIRDGAFKRGVVVATVSTGVGATTGVIGWVIGKPWLVKVLVGLGLLSKEYLK